jgi:hypothetical protein
MSQQLANEEAKKQLELFLESLMGAALDHQVAVLEQKLKDLLPGTAFDGLVEPVIASMKAAARAAALAEIEKISPLV